MNSYRISHYTFNFRVLFVDVHKHGFVKIESNCSRESRQSETLSIFGGILDAENMNSTEFQLRGVVTFPA